MFSRRKAAKSINNSISYREAYKHAGDYLAIKRLKQDDPNYLYGKSKKLVRAVRAGLKFCVSSTMLHTYPKFMWDALVVALAINNHLGDQGALDIASSYLGNSNPDVEKLYAHTNKGRRGLVVMATTMRDSDYSVSDLEKSIAKKRVPYDIQSTHRLKFSNTEPARIVQICNIARSLDTLEVYGTPMDDEHFFNIVNRSLTSLTVEACDVDIKKMRLLVSADSLNKLTSLNLNHNRLDDDCVRMLATCNNMPMLCNLDIAGVDMSDDAYDMLAEKIQHVGCFSYRDLPGDPIDEYEYSSD